MEKLLITKKGLKKLSDELDYLKKNKRREIALRIEEAKEYGDISESSEYEDAKNEQALVESRILELELMIKNSDLVASGQAKDIVGVGSKVLVKINGGERSFEIVGAAESNPEQGLISCNSPIAKSLLGLKKGEEVEIKVPNGVIKYKVLEIK